MKRMLIAAGAALLLASPVAAQDYDPSMSAHESMSQQQLNTQHNRLDQHVLNQSIRRNRGGARNRPTAGQIKACTQKRYFLSQFGPNNARVRRLYSLCRGIGR